MHTKKSILIVEDDMDYMQLVSAVLADAAFEVRSAVTLAAGLACIQQCRPEVILVDLSLSDSSGLDTFLRIQAEAEGIPIVVLTGLDDDQIAIRAVEAGAQDYLVKNSFQPRHLGRYINMALTRQRSATSPGANAPDTPGSVFSFIGSKGGVGTSTTALNVAALFARNAPTVFIEMQPGCPGTVSGYLRTEPIQFLGALLRKPANSITPLDFEPCLKPIAAGLGLFCFPASPGTWRALDAEHVQAIVSTARAAYPIVVLDLPSRIDEGVARALQLSDSVTIVADLEAASLRCGAALVHQIRMATSRTKELSLALIGRTAIDSPVPLADLQAQLEIDPLVTVPSSGASIALSYAARTPLVLLYPEDPYSVAHFELAEKLLLATSAGQYQSLGSLRAMLERESAWLPIPETTYG